MRWEGMDRRELEIMLGAMWVSANVRRGACKSCCSLWPVGSSLGTHPSGLQVLH